MPTQAISSPDAPKAIGPYSQAVRAGQLLFASGQIPTDPATGAIVDGDVAAQTRRVFDNLNAVLTFPSGYAHTFLTWTAGVRKVVYSLQGSDGALVIDDDDWELTTGKSSGKPAMEKGVIESDWMDASHTKWFNSLFDQFKTAMRSGDFVNRELREAVACVQIIETCYRSSAEGSRELPLAVDVAAL